MADGGDEETFLGVSRDEGWPAVASGEDALARIEVEAAPKLFTLSAVAFVAALDEDGADPLFKEIEPSEIGGFSAVSGLERE
jgi:hypothetical protein